jgi:hypothetical protein
MYATSSADRAGLLVAVISGGRPALKQRPTSRFLGECRAAGVQDVVWVVNDRHADAYEEDGNPVVTYSDEWAHEYASGHWMSPDRPPERGGFLGAFAGREAACREAERRGCWGVLQLDDNIVDRYWFRATRGGKAVVRERGGYAFFVDILTGVTLSTNGWMVGAQLAAIAAETYRIARPGFPYSSFIERVGPGREEWFGPYEDDITHALQYGDRADGATALVLPMLRYQKASAVVRKDERDLSGMRGQYGHDRAKMLQRLNPQSARIMVKTTTSNGRGQPRVFHNMPAGSIRNPLRIRDGELYGRVTDRMADAMRNWESAEREGNREKARLRLEAHRKATGAASASGHA